MTRTIKGSKGPGWEPWSNRHDKAAQRADYHEPVPDLKSEAYSEELEEAWYCYKYGPCPVCLARLEAAQDPP